MPTWAVAPAGDRCHARALWRTSQTHSFAVRCAYNRSAEPRRDRNVFSFALDNRRYPGSRAQW